MVQGGGLHGIDLSQQLMAADACVLLLQAPRPARPAPPGPTPPPQVAHIQRYHRAREGQRPWPAALLDPVALRLRRAPSRPAHQKGKGHWFSLPEQWTPRVDQSRVIVVGLTKD